jgi:hypothetical protein
MEKKVMTIGREGFEQMILPFAEREYVDVWRTTHILGVSRRTVYRLAATRRNGGRALLDLVSYGKKRRKRVLYSSIVRLCDQLRSRYGIVDRRPKLDHPMFRHRDEDLLPFPLSDTIYSAEALRALGYEDLRPLICLIEEGRFDAYQFASYSDWRISRSSLKAFLAATREGASRDKPTGNLRRTG